MEGQNFPYDTNEDGSSRAIAADSSNLQATTSHPSVAPPNRSRSGRNRRHPEPNEQFNAPLRPHVWTSRKQWTRSELDRERREFFETRVTGHPEIWATLKTVVQLLAEGDTSTAQTITNAAAITVPTGDLKNGAYDEAGNLYQMPAHIISDPQNMVLDSPKGEGRGETSGEATDDEEEIERRREEKGKAVISENDSVKVKARLSDRGGPDVVVSLGRDQTVRGLIKRIQEEATVRSLSLHSSWPTLLTSLAACGRWEGQNCLHGQNTQRPQEPTSSRLARGACGKCSGILTNITGCPKIRMIPYKEATTNLE